MVEQVQEQDLVGLVNKLTDALDEVLSIGNWDTSLFLRASASRLKELRDQVKAICDKDKAVADSEALDKAKEISDQVQVFVLLYQIEPSDLHKWFGTIEALTQYGATRPAYQDESHIQEFIRSKEKDIDRNAYVLVNVNKADILEQAQQDSLGHPLVTLIEGAIKQENISNFIHGNKTYKINDGELEIII